MNKSDFRNRLQSAIEQKLQCGAVHQETVFVREVFLRRTVWEGEVEIFDLVAHPKTKRVYAWNRTDKDRDEEFVMALEICPVISPQTAVRIQMVKDATGQLNVLPANC